MRIGIRPSQPLRTGIALWLLAMTGVLALTIGVLPSLLASLPRPVSMETAMIASVVQSGLLLAAAVWIGSTLAPRLGLAAPAIAAAVGRGPIWLALKPQLRPAVLVGLAVAGMLLVASQVTPADLARASGGIGIPLLAKLLYGGITEEVLMRWGLMTLLLWLLWRYRQRGVGIPRTRYVSAAAIGAAVLFGVLHLPAVMAMQVVATPPVIAYVVIGNSLPGALFGWLYWRYGLEAAIVAHLSAHAFATLAAGA